jgi:anti-sigma regulatory factor (Ser/Thr protein kinase)/anti-anti-sigma regulatory factor
VVSNRVVKLVVKVPDDLLAIQVHEELDYLMLQLSGQLSLRNVPRVREAAIKSLLSTGRVLVDLSNLRSASAALVTIFPATLATAGGWPLAQLVLFGANPVVRSSLVAARIPETVHMADDLPAARLLLQHRPPQVRRRRDLPMHNSAPLAARMFVRDACAAWSVSAQVCEVAELLATELVSNAVEHARTSSRIAVTLTDAAFRLSVRDYSPTPIPRPRPIDIHSPRGRGLHLVAGLAQSWGGQPHSDSKIMWAVIPIEPHD